MKEAKEEVWAVVELMGHVRLGGRLTEEEKFGAKLGRLDIPMTPDPKCPGCGPNGDGTVIGPMGESMVPCPACGGFVTQFFGGGSVYRITIVDEAAARAVAKHAQPAPVHAWELPKQLPAPIPHAEYDPNDDI